MSEYVIASIVNNERSIFQVKLNQTKHCWNQSGSIQNYRIISDLTFGILGLGQISSIGKCYPKKSCQKYYKV